MLLAFNKPYGVISQFTPDGSPNRTLAEFQFPARVYPIGRLDANSEGLLLLSDEAALNERLLHPRNGHERIYMAQVDRIPTPDAISQLQRGVTIAGHRTLPCRARLVDESAFSHPLPPRDPPVRFRKNVPTAWLELELVEGKNHQVRKMTAAVGFPTLRLVRTRIGRFELGALPPGEWRELQESEREQVLGAGS